MLTCVTNTHIPAWNTWTCPLAVEICRYCGVHFMQIADRDNCETVGCDSNTSALLFNIKENHKKLRQNLKRKLRVAENIHFFPYNVNPPLVQATSYRPCYVSLLPETLGSTGRRTGSGDSWHFSLYICTSLSAQHTWQYRCPKHGLPLMKPPYRHHQLQLRPTPKMRIEWRNCILSVT